MTIPEYDKRDYSATGSPGYWTQPVDHDCLTDGDENADVKMDAYHEPPFSWRGLAALLIFAVSCWLLAWCVVHVAGLAGRACAAWIGGGR